jgi:AcrR family transcriptional regulator
MTGPTQRVEGSTRDRLLRAGMQLFAEHGFRTTTVGAIESAVGLQPRRGALYKHFPSKQALLEAAVERHLDAVREVSAVMDEVPLTDVRTEATVLGRWLLDELDAEQQVIRILEQDGDRMPALRDRVRTQVSDAGYAAAARLLERWIGPAEATGVDLEALAVSLLGPLINLRRSTWLFAAPPLGLDDDRVLETWVALWVGAIPAMRPAQPTRPG